MSENREGEVTFRRYIHETDARVTLELFREIGWMGAQRATALTLTNALSGPAGLIDSLDRAFRIPPPHTDWDF
ncbi:MAG: hypothetical protein JXB06_12745 [Spirochaetales bacterium]|nr:hypothetical protein [Spirochaetales bacterium]